MTSLTIIRTPPSRIEFRIGEKHGVVYGEALLRSPGSPDFVIYAGSLKRWHTPSGEELVGHSERLLAIAELVK